MHSSNVTVVSMVTLPGRPEATLSPRTPGNQSRRFPPSETESRKGVQGEISPWSQAGGREGEAASLRALEGDSKSPPSHRGPPPLRGLEGGLQAPKRGCHTNYCFDISLIRDLSRGRGFWIKGMILMTKGTHISQ